MRRLGGWLLVLVGFSIMFRLAVPTGQPAGSTAQKKRGGGPEPTTPCITRKETLVADASDEPERNHKVRETCLAVNGEPLGDARPGYPWHEKGLDRPGEEHGRQRAACLPTAAPFAPSRIRQTTS